MREDRAHDSTRPQQPRGRRRHRHHGPGHRPGRAGRRPSRTAVRRRSRACPGGRRRDRRAARPARREGPDDGGRPGHRPGPAARRREPRRTRRLLLVVEAVLERLDVKQELLRALEDVVDDDCLLATNTSSLSVTAIGGVLRNPGRFVGLHFFNPAPLLPLVEVVSGFATDVTSATRAYEMARAWGKTPVACADTPASSSTASPGPSTPRPSRRTRRSPPTPPPSTRCCASAAASGWAPSS